MQDPALKIHPLDAALGARVDGIDLRKPLGEETFEQLRDALFQHQALFFRGQRLDDEQHLALARRFGEPQLNPVVEMAGGKRTLEFVKTGPDAKPKADGWHTDVAYLQDPPTLGILNAQIIPAKGGDTTWCNLYSVYETLPQELRDQLTDAVVEHGPNDVFYAAVLGAMGEDFGVRFKERYGGGAEHALLQRHHVTGRPFVYLSGGFMLGIVGQERAEAAALLGKLMSIADDPRHHIRWKWQVDDLAIWDERSTMHRADASYWPEPRLMRRCTVS